MKDKLLLALKKRFEGFGVSDALLDRFATKMAVSATDENVDTLVGAVQFSQLVQSEVDAKITDSNKKAVDNARDAIVTEFRTKHNLDENGKPITKPGGGEPDGEIAKLFAAQTKMIEDLSNEIKGFKTSQTKEQLRATVVEQLEKAKVPKSYYSQVNISVDDPEKVSETVTNIVSGFTAIKQDLVNQNLMFDKPQSGEVVVEDKELNNYLDEKFGTKEK